MPTTQTTDGITLSWDERGAGPDLILVSYWPGHPDAFEPIVRELEPDHRVITYDDRGCGASDRTGPYDMETSASDLEAVAEAAGVSRATALCVVDAANRALRVATRRPDLIERVSCVGGAPVNRSVFTDSDSDALIASDAVVGVFVTQLRTFYRGALRSMIEAGNPQMSQEETAERVEQLLEYHEEEAVTARLDAWQEDRQATELGRSLGDRLDVMTGDAIAGGWFPPADQSDAIYRKYFPDARFSRLTDGMVSAPGEVAEIVRRARANLESTP